MRRTWFPLCGVAVVGLLTGGAAWAQEKPADKKPIEAKPVEPPVGTATKRQLAKPGQVAAAMRADKVELTKAVSAAEAHSKGHAVGAMGDVREERTIFHVHCVVGEKCMECIVDHDGKVMGMVELPANEEKRMHGGTAAEVLKAMETAKMTFAKSIAADAEHHKGATMVSAVAKFDKGEPEVYFTCVDADNKQIRSEINKEGTIRDMKPRATAGGEGEAQKEPPKGAEKKDGEKKEEAKKP